MIILICKNNDESKTSLPNPRHPNHPSQLLPLHHPQPHLRHQQLHRRRIRRLCIDGIRICITPSKTTKTIQQTIHHPRLRRLGHHRHSYRHGLGGYWRDYWGNWSILGVNMPVAGVFIVYTAIKIVINLNCLNHFHRLRSSQNRDAFKRIQY